MPATLERALAAALTLCATGCVKEITSDERLDRGTRNLSVEKAIGASELERVRCDDTAEPLARARDENGPETDRVNRYLELYLSLEDRRATFDEAMSRNPDLAYRPGSEALTAARDLCVRQAADVRLEFERYVRELVALPTVKEIKGGKTVTVVRLDFPTLKRAIELLKLDDGEVLVSKLDRAEQKLKLH